ncbi:dihydrodipicolinate synthase family protein [Microbacterium sp. NPDC089189]|uniref:dihydrodipicolinate synthase family protein n=1 Tax=Microbacterium sp. NPDC089189 TaxID=3154972 RepID=UPI003420DCE6
MLYDGSNGIRLDPEVLRRAHDSAPNIRYAKIATADPALFEAYHDAAPGVTTIVGEDMMLFQGLRAGGRGSATAIGNILPREIAALHDAFENGQGDATYEIATRLSPVTMFLSIPKGGFIAKFKHMTVPLWCSPRVRMSIGRGATTTRRASIRISRRRHPSQRTRRAHGWVTRAARGDLQSARARVRRRMTAVVTTMRTMPEISAMGSDA